MVTVSIISLRPGFTGDLGPAPTHVGYAATHYRAWAARGRPEGSLVSTFGEFSMFYGSPTLCLKVEDLAASRRFYEALGFVPFNEVDGRRVVLRRGHFTLALMTFLEANLINFRGADVAAAHRALKAQLPELDGEPERYVPDQSNQADAAGMSWLTRDPDGNTVFFDTNENEQGAAYKQKETSQILRNTEQALLDAGASKECLAAFRGEVLRKFAAPE